MPVIFADDLNDLIKKLAEGLKEYRHVLLNATAANYRDIRQIEHRIAYMSEATDIFNKILEDIREATEGKPDED